MTLSLEIHSVFSPAFAFSPLNTGMHTAAKPAKLMGVSPNSFSLGVYSTIAGMIVLGFLTDNIGFQTNGPPFYNGVSLSQATSCPQEPTASSTPTESAKENQQSTQLDQRRDPAPWPLPPPSRSPSGSQPPSRSSGSTRGGIPRRRKMHYNRHLRRPFREDPPPPPPPSLAGFMQDFPKPQNFEEKLFGYFRGRKASRAQRTKILPSSLPKRAPTSTPKKTGDRSRPKPSRSRLPERRQISFPLQPQQPSRPAPLLWIVTLTGSGSLILFGYKARRRATGVQPVPNQLIVPPVVVRSHNYDSDPVYPVLYEHESPADISYLNRLSRSQSTPPNSRREPSTTRRSPTDRVRLSKTEHVRYFYKDEIIGFENGPRPRGRRSSSVS